MKLTPRQYQIDAVDTAIHLLDTEPDVWHMFSSPTGTGKSVMELLLLDKRPNGAFITPRVEIIAGILDKKGYDIDDMSHSSLTDLAATHKLYTPIKFRNILSQGRLNYHPEYLIVDECHHDLADSYQDITMYLNGVPKVGFTATPYRGTPRATKAFHEQWSNRINEVMNMQEAVADGYCSFPTATIWPLVDDDIIEVVNGEISSKSADTVISDRIASIVERCRKYYCKKSRLWDRPTMFAVPTTNLAVQLTNELNAAGLSAVAVTQNTSRNARKSAFHATVNCDKALVQIDVVSEGVDLPIRRLIDCKPTLSPVRWIQQVGRIMRPIATCDVCRTQSTGACNCEPMPEYICVCRNIERHGHLMEGLFPSSTFKEAQEAFTVPSRRSGMRAVGLEGLGKFINTPVQLLNGITVFCYSLVHMDQFKRTEYFVLVHPGHTQPVYCSKQSNRDGTDIKWGKWALIESIADVRGFQSAKPYPLTDPQQNVWNEHAERVGLSPHQKVTNRNIQTLFVLLNTGLRFR